MQIHFTGHHIEMTDALKAFTAEKLERIQRHFDRILTINITFAVEKLNKVVEATVHVPGRSLHASSESEDMYSAVDLLVDKLDRQIKRHKEKETEGS